MNTLSMLQPWATLAVRGIKQWETRTRNIGIPLGRLLIHASAGVDKAGFGVWMNFLEQFPEVAEPLPFWVDLPRGKIIGHVDVTSTLAGDLILPKLTKMERLLGNYDVATYFARFEKPEEFAVPIPAKGQLGVWQFYTATPNN